MDENTKMIKDFCEGEISFEELSGEIKYMLLDSKMVNEDGKFTDLGNSLRNAITAKFVPGKNNLSSNEWPYIFRP